MPTSAHLSGEPIEPMRIDGGTSIAELIDRTFTSYNAGRLRDGARLLTERALGADVVVGLTMTGALTPTGLGVSALIPLIEAGFIDWIVTTGGNLYHDAHFGLGLPLHRGNPSTPDPDLRREEVVRIYDIFFDYEILLDTDAFFRGMIEGQEFQRRLSTAEFHHLCGRYLGERERALGKGRRSLLAACHDYDVPVYTPAPGDSSIGLNTAASALEGSRLEIDPTADVNEAAAILLNAKRQGLESAVIVLGGGSPKNFILQTEPYLQEVLGIEVEGHDYYLQITDDRPDTGSLSGALPAQRAHDELAGELAADGGRPDGIPSRVTCYSDVTLAFPLLTAYIMSVCSPREPRRLYQRRSEAFARLREEASRVAADGEARERARHSPRRQVTLERDR